MLLSSSRATSAPPAKRRAAVATAVTDREEGTNFIREGTPSRVPAGWRSERTGKVRAIWRVPLAMSNDGPDIARNHLNGRGRPASGKDVMAILFKSGAGDPELWKREITARVPGQEFRSWPEVGDPDDIEFVLLFRAEPGMFVP